MPAPDSIPPTERTPHVGSRHHAIAFTETAMHEQVKKELHWYFTYAEAARRQGTIAFLPVHASSPGEDDDASRRRATELARTIQVTLGRLPARDAGVLRAAFTPRRWPMAVARAFADVAPIVVRLVSAAHPWPVRTSNDGLESAAAKDLARLLTRPSREPVVLRKRARGLMTRAITAYASARTKGGVPSNSES